MKKTINVLPAINELTISGRIASEPTFNEAKTKCSFRLLHNHGREQEPSAFSCVMFSKESKFPMNLLKLGRDVMIVAAKRDRTYNDKHYTEFVVKDITRNGANSYKMAGRLTADAEVKKTDKGTSCRFRVIRNIGGENNEPVTCNFIMFNKDGEYPLDLLKKGAAVVVDSIIRSDNFVNEAGEKRYKNQYIVRTVKAAELVTKEIEVKDGQVQPAQEMNNADAETVPEETQAE